MGTEDSLTFKRFGDHLWKYIADPAVFGHRRMAGFICCPGRVGNRKGNKIPDQSAAHSRKRQPLTSSSVNYPSIGWWSRAGCLWCGRRYRRVRRLTLRPLGRAAFWRHWRCRADVNAFWVNGRWYSTHSKGMVPTSPWNYGVPNAIVHNTLDHSLNAFGILNMPKYDTILWKCPETLAHLGFWVFLCWLPCAG